MKFISIDLETTGLDPETCQILEFGAIYEDTDDPKAYQEADKFHSIINRKILTGQPYAIQMNNMLIRIIAGKDPIPDGCQLICEDKEAFLPVERTLLFYFTEWAKDVLKESNNFRINVAGKNFASCDLNFLKPFIDKTKQTGELFRHRVIDVGSMWMEKEDITVPSMPEVLRRAGFDGPTDEHSALGDAWDVIKAIRRKFGYGLDKLDS